MDTCLIPFLPKSGSGSCVKVLKRAGFPTEHREWKMALGR